MDMMMLRRGLLAQMASGAQFIKGTFTTPTNQTTYTLNFGKSFNKYLFFVEMTNESKATLVDAGLSGYRTFCIIGRYPSAYCNGKSVSTVCQARIRASDNSVDTTASSAIESSNESSITFTNRALSYGANCMYQGYTYNYYVAEIK